MFNPGSFKIKYQVNKYHMCFSVPNLYHLDVLRLFVCPSDSQGYMSGGFSFWKVQPCSEGLRSRVQRKRCIRASRLEVVLRVNYLHIEKRQVTETNNNYNQKSSVSRRAGIPLRKFMTRCSQTHQGAAGLKTHLHLYTNPRLLSHNSVFLGTWNVRTFWETEKCAQAAREMQIRPHTHWHFRSTLDWSWRDQIANREDVALFRQKQRTS